MKQAAKIKILLTEFLKTPSYKRDAHLDQLKSELKKAGFYKLDIEQRSRIYKECKSSL